MKRLQIARALPWVVGGLILGAVGLYALLPARRPVLPATGSAGREVPAPGSAEDGVPIAGPVRAMWVWDARIVLTPESRARLLSFCRRHRIDALFLSAYDLRSPLDRSFRQFNREAHRAGISVQALAGDPRWGKSQYHHVPLQWVEAVRQLNARAPPAERFDGIHTDVEVYLLSKTWTEHPEILLGGYLDLNSLIAELLRQDARPMHFAVDIPFWFDDDPSYRILWNGQVKAPSQHVLDTVDSVTVMAYRNFAEGSDGTVHLVSLEMDYADGIGKRVIVGQETQENLYPAYVTFGGTSCATLRREVEKIERSVGRRPSFGGFAYHHYESYRKLCGE